MALCFGYSESRKFKNHSKTLQHFDVLGICISISVHAIARRVRYRTYRRGLGVACSGERQYQSQCSGTATVQSRFFCIQIKAEHNRRYPLFVLIHE